MNRLKGIVTVLVLSFSSLYAQGKIKKVLFIGNSYTSTNDLPLIIAKMAAAGGDSLVYKKSIDGGRWFRQHATDPATLNLIAEGNWDYVVLQEQSQAPAFQEYQVIRDVYPYAKKLDSLVHKYNKCTKTVFYMTWGRQIGDTQNCANHPEVCTYAGMDDLLQLRYSKMAEDNAAQLCPVGRVWRNIRTNHPGITLYIPDGSHPSPAGSFIAASGFYTMFFGKDPSLNAFTGGLPVADANIIKQAAKAIVYDSLAYWKRHSPEPLSAFSYTKHNNDVAFHAPTVAGVTYEWDFGDAGAKGTTADVNHTYAQQGTYTVCLKVYNACDTSVTCQTVNLGTTGINGNSQTVARYYPNPTTGMLTLELPAAGYRYAVYNTVGALLMEGRLAQANAGLDLRALATGMYFVQLTDVDHNAEVIRVVKSL
ncbi:PKD domain-containing protein [Taibaiella chishuiensis]|uniref:Putative secreted protein (Por secretion system target) n=1 Tax=Taibaiella chishuiensis TaxID=1434707 RepID=A0A2P8D8K0_9BACT|nr:PKD domain-containing protein [Taibaiella chishuiensis]PSK93539.1 putative secreted protein (Por secretion system target) [Taibaiella chishuiensis]